MAGSSGGHSDHDLGHRVFTPLKPAGSDVDFTFDYNPASQIETRRASNDAYAFPAPAAGVTAYRANGRNQMVKAGAADPWWDPKGNLASDGTNSYGYSAESLLTTIVNPTGRYQTSASLS